MLEEKFAVQEEKVNGMNSFVERIGDQLGELYRAAVKPDEESEEEQEHDQVLVTDLWNQILLCVRRQAGKRGPEAFLRAKGVSAIDSALIAPFVMEAHEGDAIGGRSASSPATLRELLVYLPPDALPDPAKEAAVALQRAFAEE